MCGAMNVCMAISKVWNSVGFPKNVESLAASRLFIKKEVKFEKKKIVHSSARIAPLYFRTIPKFVCGFYFFLFLLIVYFIDLCSSRITMVTILYEVIFRARAQITHTPICILNINIICAAHKYNIHI